MAAECYEKAALQGYHEASIAIERLAKQNIIFALLARPFF